MKYPPLFWWSWEQSKSSPLRAADPALIEGGAAGVIALVSAVNTGASGGGVEPDIVAEKLGDWALLL